MKAQVTHVGVLDLQVCVPSDWDDDRIARFANTENIAGTQNGWNIRKEEKYEKHPSERVPCSERDGFVHVMLDC